MEPILKLGYKCAVCESNLNLYKTHSILKCHYCKSSFATTVICEKGHFVCPICETLHADPSEFDTTEEYEEARRKALESYDDRENIVGTVCILILSSVKPDNAEELGEFYNIDHNFDEAVQ